MRLWRHIVFGRGRWLGRKDAIVAGSRGITTPDARRFLAERAAELGGSALAGYWRGVLEVRPDWQDLRPPQLLDS